MSPPHNNQQATSNKQQSKMTSQAFHNLSLLAMRIEEPEIAAALAAFTAKVLAPKAVSANVAVNIASPFESAALTFGRSLAAPVAAAEAEAVPTPPSSVDGSDDGRTSWNREVDETLVSLAENAGIFYMTFFEDVDVDDNEAVEKAHKSFKKAARDAGITRMDAMQEAARRREDAAIRAGQTREQIAATKAKKLATKARRIAARALKNTQITA